MIALAWIIIVLFVIVFFASITLGEQYDTFALIFIVALCALPIAQSILVLMGR